MPASLPFAWALADVENFNTYRVGDVADLILQMHQPCRSINWDSPARGTC
jgi:hypothetical protein